MKKKAMLLAMAVAAITVLAIPTLASAAWTKNHEPIASNVEIEMTGTDVKLESEFGSITCTTISKLLFESANGGNTGTIKTFEPEGLAENVCHGGGAVKHCIVKEAEIDGLPWIMHTATVDTVKITTGKMTFDLQGFLCPDPTALAAEPTFRVAEGHTKTTSTGTLEGGVSLENPFENGSISGTLHVLGAIIYGI